MAITTLSMVLTVLVLNLHHISDKPVSTLSSHWLRTHAEIDHQIET
jgi:hypothetical protein